MLKGRVILTLLLFWSMFRHNSSVPLPHTNDRFLSAPSPETTVSSGKIVTKRTGCSPSVSTKLDFCYFKPSRIATSALLFTSFSYFCWKDVVDFGSCWSAIDRSSSGALQLVWESAMDCFTAHEIDQTYMYLFFYHGSKQRPNGMWGNTEIGVAIHARNRTCYLYFTYIIRLFSQLI